MKQHFISLFLIVFIFQFVSAESIEIKNNNDEKLAIYFLHNYRNNQNSFSSTINGGIFTGIYNLTGRNHSIQNIGIGLKYFPKDYYFINFEYKTLIGYPEIGFYSDSSITSIQQNLLNMNSYSFMINYSHKIIQKINFYAGIGISINRIELAIFGLSNYINLNSEFNSWIGKIGINYYITRRCAISLSIGYEENITLQIFDNNNRRYTYNFNAPFFIEPAINFYF